MSQLTIKLSDKADALIAQLQKEIFNRRRKKVSPAGVVETLVESGAKSQSDKRFATSWKNLVTDIEKAAKEANAHGVKPAGLSDAEWALILSHRSRSGAKATSKAKVARQAPAAKKTTATKTTATKVATVKSKAPSPAADGTAKAAAAGQSRTGRKSATAKVSGSTPGSAPLPSAPSSGRKAAAAGKTRSTSKPSKPVGASSRRSAAAGGSSVTKRMAKAVSRLHASALQATNAVPTANGNGAVVVV
jgi:hypothetical protein